VESEKAGAFMASVVERAYNVCLEAKPPAGLRGRAPGEGSNPTSNVSSKIRLIRLTVADSINHT